MDFPDGSTRQKLPLLFVGERLLDTLLIQSARCPAQRGVELFEVIRLNLLNLLLAEIGHDKILDHGYRVGVGFGCPLVLLDWMGSHLYSISATVIASGMRNVPSSSSFSTVILRSCASALVLKVSQPLQGLPA